MLITCFVCRQSFTVTHWNPARFVTTCPTPSCGRQVHVGHAAKVTYGDKVGEQVSRQLAVLENLKGGKTADHSHIIETVARRVERTMNVVEAERQRELLNERLLKFLAGANRLVKGNTMRIKQPSGPPVDICLVADKLARYLRKEKRARA